MNIMLQLESILGVAPEGYEYITYATSCVLLLMLCALLFRFLMSIFGRR